MDADTTPAFSVAESTQPTRTIARIAVVHRRQYPRLAGGRRYTRGGDYELSRQRLPTAVENIALTPIEPVIGTPSARPATATGPSVFATPFANRARQSYIPCRDQVVTVGTLGTSGRIGLGAANQRGSSRPYQGEPRLVCPTRLPEDPDRCSATAGGPLWVTSGVDPPVHPLVPIR